MSTKRTQSSEESHLSEISNPSEKRVKVEGVKAEPDGETPHERTIEEINEEALAALVVVTECCDELMSRLPIAQQDLFKLDPLFVGGHHYAEVLNNMSKLAAQEEETRKREESERKKIQMNENVRPKIEASKPEPGDENSSEEITQENRDTNQGSSQNPIQLDGENEENEENEEKEENEENEENEEKEEETFPESSRVAPSPTTSVHASNGIPASYMDVQYSVHHVNPFLNSSKGINRGFGPFIRESRIGYGSEALSQNALGIRQSILKDGFSDEKYKKLLTEIKTTLKEVHRYDDTDANRLARKHAFYYSKLKVGDYIIMRHVYKFCPYCPDFILDECGSYPISGVYVIGQITGELIADTGNVFDGEILKCWQKDYFPCTFFAMGRMSDLHVATRKYLNKICQPTVCQLFTQVNDTLPDDHAISEARKDLWVKAKVKIKNPSIDFKRGALWRSFEDDGRYIDPPSKEEVIKRLNGKKDLKGSQTMTSFFQRIPK